MSPTRPKPLALVLERGSVYVELQEIGRAVGPIASLGAVLGLVAAAAAKTLVPEAEVSYGEWIGYSGAMAGLFSLVVEIANRAG